LSGAPLDPAAYGAWFETPLGRRVWSDEEWAVVDLLGPVAGRRVLDAGCGDGRLAVALAGSDVWVVGVDIDVSMLRAARARAGEGKVRLNLVQADVERLPLASETVDAAVAVTTLCVITDPTAAARELARVLKPGGRIVLGELGRWSIWALGRRLRALTRRGLWASARFWTKAALVRLLREVGLTPVAARGAVFYPRSEWLGRLLGSLDRHLGKRITIGAAFIGVAGDKPRGSPLPGCG
jgi:SAM-dependent methyltransferase